MNAEKDGITMTAGDPNTFVQFDEVVVTAHHHHFKSRPELRAQTFG
jgi:hypothetical protein